MTYIIVIILILAFSFVVDAYLIKRRKKVDGHIVLFIKDDGKKLFSLEIDKDLDDIAVGDYILFQVTNEPIEELE